ncbi:flagellar motor switch protein FliN [Nocardioides pacificus]
MTAAPLADQLTELAIAVATAATEVIPSAEPLVAMGAQPGTEHVTAAFAGGVTAELQGPVTGRLGLLVAQDLVAALETSPLGGLDLAAAVQPTLDVIATALGTQVGPAKEVDLKLIVGDVGPDFTVVPLLGSGFAAAVLLQDATLSTALVALAAAEQAAAEPEPVPAAQPEPQVVVAQPIAQPMTQPAAQPVAQPVAQPIAQPVPQAVPQAATPLPAAPQPQAGAVSYEALPAVGNIPQTNGAVPRRGIEMLHGVDMEVTVELGRTRMTVRDLLALSPGAVLELDRAAGSPADLLVNGRLIARGEVVVVDEDFGLRVTEIITDTSVG